MSCPVANHGRQDRKSNGRIPINLGIVQAHPIPESRVRHWVYGIHLDGTYFFMPDDEMPGEIMAHLGIYNPLTDTLRLLEFQE